MNMLIYKHYSRQQLMDELERTIRVNQSLLDDNIRLRETLNAQSSPPIPHLGAIDDPATIERLRSFCT